MHRKYSYLHGCPNSPSLLALHVCGEPPDASGRTMFKWLVFNIYNSLILILILKFLKMRVPKYVLSRFFNAHSPYLITVCFVGSLLYGGRCRAKTGEPRTNGQSACRIQFCSFKVSTVVFVTCFSRVIHLYLWPFWIIYIKNNGKRQSVVWIMFRWDCLWERGCSVPCAVCRVSCAVCSVPCAV